MLLVIIKCQHSSDAYHIVGSHHPLATPTNVVYGVAITSEMLNKHNEQGYLTKEDIYPDTLGNKPTEESGISTDDAVELLEEVLQASLLLLETGIDFIRSKIAVNKATARSLDMQTKVMRLTAREELHHDPVTAFKPKEE